MSKYSNKKNGNRNTLKFRSPWGQTAPTIKFAPPERVELDIAVFFRPELAYRDEDGEAHPFAPVSDEPIMGAMLVAPTKNSSGSTATILPIRLRQLVPGDRGEVRQRPTIETVEVATAVCPKCGRIMVDGDKMVDLGVGRKEARNVHSALADYGRCPQCGSPIAVEDATDEDMASLFGYRISVVNVDGDVANAANVLWTPGVDKMWFQTMDEAKESIAKAKQRVVEAAALGISVDSESVDGTAFSVIKTESLTPESGTPPAGWFTANVSIVPQTVIWRQEFGGLTFPAEPPAMPEFIVCVASMGESWPAYFDQIKGADLKDCLDQLQSDGCFPFLVDSLPIAMAAKKDDKGRSPEVDPTKFYFVDEERGGDYVSAGWHIRQKPATGRMLVEDFPIMDNTSNTPKFLFLQKGKFSSRTVTFG